MSDSPSDGSPQPPSAPQPPISSAPPSQPPAPQPTSAWGQAALSGEATIGVGTHDDGTQGVAGAQPGIGIPAAGGGRSVRSTSPRGPKPIRGPRFSGSPLIAGLGLLGLLVTIAIMALLAVRVLDGMNSAAEKVNSPTVPGVVGGLVPGEPLPDGAEASGGNATDAARAATCAASKAVIETAVETYSTIEGSQPTSIDDLVSTGFMQTNDGNFKLEPAPDGTVKVVGIGECELVN